eukprot:gene22429-29541_t
MLHVSKNLTAGKSSPGLLHSEFVASSCRPVPRDTRGSLVLPHVACPLEDEVSTSSSLSDKVGPSCLRHLENSWAGSSTGRSPWALHVSVDEKPQRTRNNDKDSFFANVGDCIRSLREDIPSLFERELNYDIYTENILFKDPKITFQGKKNYKTMFWSLRFHGRLFFKSLYVEVIRIWQPEDSVIKMRWTVHGLPRLFGDRESLFDGISTYKLNESGRIYEHSVNNVLLRDTKAFSAAPILAGIDRALGGGAPVPQQVPFPGAWGYDADQQAGQASARQDSSSLAHTSSACPSEESRGEASPSAVWMPLFWSMLTARAMAHVFQRSSDNEELVLHRADKSASDQHYYLELEGSGA